MLAFKAFHSFFFLCLQEEWLDVSSLPGEGERNVLRMQRFRKSYWSEVEIYSNSLSQKLPLSRTLLPWTGSWWCSSKPDWFLVFLGGWGVFSSLYISVSQVQAFCRSLCQAQNLHEVMKGSGQCVLNRLFFSYTLSQPQLQLVPMVRKAALCHGCLRRHLQPCPGSCGQWMLCGGARRRGQTMEKMICSPHHFQASKNCQREHPSKPVPETPFPWEVPGPGHLSPFWGRAQREAAGLRGCQDTHTHNSCSIFTYSVRAGKS